MQHFLDPIVISVIAASGGVIIIIVIVGIKWATDVVDLTLSARDLYFISRCAILASFHREHFHFFFKAEFFRYRTNLRVLLLFLLFRQSLLSRVPESKVFFSTFASKVYSILVL